MSREIIYEENYSFTHKEAELPKVEPQKLTKIPDCQTKCLTLQAEMGDELDQKGKPKTVGMGHYRLELCLSADQQFCALQLFRFTDFQNQPVTEPRFYEGSEAATFAKLL